MNKNRRKFLITGAAAVPAALCVENFAIANPVIATESSLVQTHNLLLQPNTFVRLDKNFDKVSTVPWAVAEEDADLLPYIVGQRHINLGEFLKTQAEVSAGTKNSASEAASNAALLERLSSLRLQGEIPVSDIIGDISMARAANRSVDITFNFFDKITGQHPEVTSKIGDASPINTPQVDVLRPPKGNYTPKYLRVPIPVPFTKYTLQFRGPDTSHRMTPCAPEARSHYHLELRKDNVYVANFHIAIWRVKSQICFAVANNYGRPPCFKICNPSWTQIKNAIQQQLVGIGISLAVASVIATAVAALVYGSLGALAI